VDENCKDWEGGKGAKSQSRAHRPARTRHWQIANGGSRLATLSMASEGEEGELWTGQKWGAQKPTVSKRVAKSSTSAFSSSKEPGGLC